MRQVPRIHFRITDTYTHNGDTYKRDYALCGAVAGASACAKGRLVYDKDAVTCENCKTHMNGGKSRKGECSVPGAFAALAIVMGAVTVAALIVHSDTSRRKTDVAVEAIKAGLIQNDKGLWVKP